MISQVNRRLLWFLWRRQKPLDIDYVDRVRITVHGIVGLIVWPRSLTLVRSACPTPSLFSSSSIE